jgi:hypothetical protein
MGKVLEVEVYYILSIYLCYDGDDLPSLLVPVLLELELHDA